MNNDEIIENMSAKICDTIEQEIQSLGCLMRINHFAVKTRKYDGWRLDDVVEDMYRQIYESDKPLESCIGQIPDTTEQLDPNKYYLGEDVRVIFCNALTDILKTLKEAHDKDMKEMRDSYVQEVEKQEKEMNKKINSISNDIEIVKAALKSANDMCRSFHYVIERNGFDTNWDALHDQLSKSLVLQHRAMYPENYEKYATDESDESDETVSDLLKRDKLTASEALFGFCAWLTTRKEVTKMGSSENCSPIPDLIRQFMRENDLDAPRDGWENNLIHPSGECSHGNEGNDEYEPPGECYAWETIARGLYKILDDIDTASDHYKPEKSRYSHYVMDKVKEKGNYMWSDGYKVYPRDKFPAQTESDDPMIDYFVDCNDIEKTYDLDLPTEYIPHIETDVKYNKNFYSGIGPLLHSTMDANVWASEFCKTYKKLYNRDIDEEWVHSWMCNALMCGWDHQSWRRDKEYIYILKTRGGDILKVFHWEPTEKDIRTEYIKHYPEDVVGKDYDVFDYTRLFRWSRECGWTEMVGPNSSKFDWKGIA